MQKSLRFTNEQYLRDHPELQKLLHDFVCQGDRSMHDGPVLFPLVDAAACAVLEERPQNLVGFAATYFSQKETPKS